jgi:type IV pilus assembly protein PilQ
MARNLKIIRRVKQNFILMPMLVAFLYSAFFSSISLAEPIKSVLQSTQLTSEQALAKLPPNELSSVITAAPRKLNKQAIVTNKDFISLNFEDIKVRSVLQLLAQFSGINIVTSDTINGSITLHLENIPWQQALAIILQTQTLGKKQFGNVVYIAPLKELAEQEKQQLETAQQLQDLGPLSSDLIQINYGKALDIATLLKTQGGSLLSTRGNVSIDGRTNTIWVQDVPSRLADIRKLIQQLDVPVKQVLIEARIVNINSNFAQEMGVRFGLTRPDNLSGTLVGADSTNAGVIPVGNVPNAFGAALNNRLNVDLPAANTGAIGGAASIGLALARIGSGTLLDLELSAMESEGEGHVISSPRVITADQQAAVIQSGQEIPYQEATSSGATSISFKNAVLSLSVTPQITPDGKVNLSLKVNQDSPNYNKLIGGPNGVPAINTRSIETHVMVDNGQTIVLGGIYETQDGKIVKRVPFLGSLPVIGALFRNTTINNSRQELLIFITPKVLKQAQTTT